MCSGIAADDVDSLLEIFEKGLYSSLLSSCVYHSGICIIDFYLATYCMQALCSRGLKHVATGQHVAL